MFASLGFGRIASVHGRYWAMDRDNRWERIQRTHSLLTEGAAAHREQSAAAALDAAYARGEDDEFVAPTIIGEPATLADGDAVLFMNFRADRARQLSQSLIESGFSGFSRRMAPNINLVTTTEYASTLSCPVAFPPDTLEDSLGEVLAEHGLTQLRIAETEKYAHVTFSSAVDGKMPSRGDTHPHPVSGCRNLRPSTGDERPRGDRFSGRCHRRRSV